MLKIEQDSNQVIQMEYTIPYLASNGNFPNTKKSFLIYLSHESKLETSCYCIGSPVEASDDTSVVSILPQPTAESKR